MKLCPFSVLSRVALVAFVWATVAEGRSSGTVFDRDMCAESVCAGATGGVVCGLEGMTYDNACMAEKCAKVSANN